MRASAPAHPIRALARSARAPSRHRVIFALMGNEIRIYRRDLRVVVLLVALPLVFLILIGNGLAPDVPARTRDIRLHVSGANAAAAVEELRRQGFDADISADGPSAAPFQRSTAAVRLGGGAPEVAVADIDMPIRGALTSAVSAVLLRAGPAAVAGPDSLSPYDVALPGLSLAFGFFLVAILAANIARESIWGTWHRLVAGPFDRFSLIAGKLIVHIAIFVCQLWLMVGLGRVLFGAGTHLGLDALPRVTLVGLTAGMCAVGLALLVASWGKSLAAIAQLSNLVVLLPAALGGAFVPLAYLPAWERQVAPLVPMYWAVNEMRSVMADSVDWATTAQRIAVLLAAGLVLLVVGVRRLKWAELRYTA